MRLRHLLLGEQRPSAGDGSLLVDREKRLAGERLLLVCVVRCRGATEERRHERSPLVAVPEDASVVEQLEALRIGPQTKEHP